MRRKRRGGKPAAEAVRRGGKPEAGAVRRGRKLVVGAVRRGPKLAAGAVVLATSGLTSCNDNGAVDPAPPPLECPEVNEGQTLFPTGVLDGTRLTITIDNEVFANWASVEVIDPIHATVVSVSPEGTRVRITLELVSQETTLGSFTLQGELEDLEGTRCAVIREFDFQITDGTVTVAALECDPIPLAARDRATIVVTRHAGKQVELEGRSTYQGPCTFRWTVTSGSIDACEGKRILWQLPEDPGLYQIELVVDYGVAGLAIDTMAFEVS